MREMVDIAALNSRVKFDKTDIPFEKREILGDATETGLARFAGKYLENYDELHAQHPKVFEVPFNSTNKWALVIVSAAPPRVFLVLKRLMEVNKPHKDGVLASYIKGAPERVLAKCSTYFVDGKEVPISDEFKKAYDNAYTVRVRDCWLHALLTRCVRA